MRNTLLLAWRSLSHQRLKSAVLVVAVALMLYLPLVLHGLLTELQAQWLARAEATPLIIGARGSRLDLVLHGLYFYGAAPSKIPYREVERVARSGYAEPIPLHRAYSAQEAPLVGTSLDYLTFRGLTVAQGTPFLMLGDCVVGARAARRLGVRPGDKVLSDPDNLFDLAGSYPLRMKVAGVLAESHSPDDDAVFVDLKTVWVIEGRLHGHVDVAEEANQAFVVDRDGNQILASAGIAEFTEITPENAGSFHFHGDRGEMPVTAIIAVPRDEKGETILRGRYLGPEQTMQALVPADVVRETMAVILRVKRVFDANVLLVGVSGGLFLLLIVLLSLRLRAAERRTLSFIGASRWTVFRLQAMELALTLAAGILLAAVLALATTQFIPGLTLLLLAAG